MLRILVLRPPGVKPSTRLSLVRALLLAVLMVVLYTYGTPVFANLPDCAEVGGGMYICWSNEPPDACQTYNLEGFCSFVCASVGKDLIKDTADCTDLEDYDVVSCGCSNRPER